MQIAVKKVQIFIVNGYEFLDWNKALAYENYLKDKKVTKCEDNLCRSLESNAINKK